MASTIQIRVDDELKEISDALFKDLGTDTTTAVRIFLTQAVAQNGFPFEIKRQTTNNSPYRAMSESDMMSKLERARNSNNYRAADDVISDMRSNMEYEIIMTDEAESDL
jgi:DNA-damage-inducible protein J